MKRNRNLSTICSISRKQSQARLIVRKEETRGGTVSQALRAEMYYDGEFAKGLMHGKGQLVWPDGRVCSGTWLNGERSTKETATITWTNGDVYIGSLDSHYRPSGVGTKTYSDGDKYEGQWDEGLAHGEGVLHQNGVYTGTFSGGQKNGEGEQRYDDGAVFVGSWKENQPSGAGVLTYANKDVYSGYWLKGKQNGVGELKFSNGDVSQGTFENDELHGPQCTKSWKETGDKFTGEYSHGKRVVGRMEYGDKRVYEGAFKDSKAHGKGRLYFPEPF